MVAKEFLLMAAEAENDRLGATLVAALREELTTAETGYDEGLQPLHASVEPRFYGVGGHCMADSGVELIFKTSALPATPPRSFRHLLTLRRVFGWLYHLALAREPHAIIGLGFLGINLRFARALKRYVRHRQGTFYNWNPVFVQVGVTPGWLQRPSRLQAAGRELDLLLSLDRPESVDYAKHAPNLRVVFVGPTTNSAPPLESSRRAAQAIVKLLIADEAHFPLRASLSGS
jgi:lipid A disaccharide synthetase